MVPAAVRIVKADMKDIADKNTTTNLMVDVSTTLRTTIGSKRITADKTAVMVRATFRKSAGDT